MSIQQMFLGVGAGAPTGPGVISAVYNSNSDGYSGGNLASTTCQGTSYSSFDARPPNQTQVNSQMDAWMKCKSYAGDGVSPGTAIFWGNTGNSLVLTFTDFAADQELGIYLYTNEYRPITFSGLFAETNTSLANGYRYFNVNSAGGGTLTCAFGSTGDPPYIKWCGPRYDDPGYPT